ncbi:hypothetical protein E2C01_074647 [Portunus trituberculatus]|uniref:Uncharacterized protein n=1 Tax=Portunus trituberculatus TaxID=210409 RepID=A0A5B7I667_PORTR|nr:hypothetical protein [Portunus trituberculatus]
MTVPTTGAFKATTITTTSALVATIITSTFTNTQGTTTMKTDIVIFSIAINAIATHSTSSS